MENKKHAQITTNQHYFLRTAFALLILMAFSQCENSDSGNTTKSLTHTTDTVVQKSSQPKSKEEVIVNGAVQVAEGVTTLIQQGLQNKRYKDSLKAADREEFWVYTIGVPYDDADEMAASYEKLKDLSNIAVYENDDEYTLIKTGASENELENAKGEFKSELEKAGISDQKIQIKNLAGNCGKRNHIVRGLGKKLKKKHADITSYMCN